MPVSPDVKDLFPSLAKLSPGPLQALAMAAEGWLVKVLGRDLDGGAKTETLSGENQPILWLANTPVSSVESVVIEDVTQPATGYYFAKNGQLFRSKYGFRDHMRGWDVGIKNITVNYTSQGLSQSEQDMLIGTVMNWFVEQNSRSVMLSSERIGDYNYTLNTAFSRGIPQAVNTVIYPYMSWGVA
jgi:hypothetical protein